MTPALGRSLRQNGRTHFGDPCVHCGIPHDDVPVGPCKPRTLKERIMDLPDKTMAALTAPYQGDQG